MLLKPSLKKIQLVCYFFNSYFINPNKIISLLLIFQGALAKERREQKMVDRQAADSEAPTGSTKNWNDPMPHGVTEYQVNKLVTYFGLDVVNRLGSVSK